MREKIRNIRLGTKAVLSRNGRPPASLIAGAAAGAVLLAALVIRAAALPGPAAGGNGGAPASGGRAAKVRLEGQPRADDGDGRFHNPIMSGEYPDPSVVRLGKDYYLTHTPGAWTPGLLIWHSRDLVNWEPLGCAVSGFAGDIWAPDLTFYRGLFYLYFPARVRDGRGGFRQSCFVITAADPRGPWSEPVDLDVPAIDPGHIADDAGNRFLYVSGGRMVRLSTDGLKTAGAVVKVYDGWDIPAGWNIECKCLESPKLFARGGFYYLVSAEGGTAGPATSHMAVVARSKSPAGPWENSPLNPLIRTSSRDEKWWSQGHGTVFEAADGGWWIMYHGYENGYRTLGRRTLLAPLEWTPDGWPKLAAGADPGRELRKPAGEDVGHGLPLSDDFRGAAPGPQWRRPAFDGGSDVEPRTGDGFLRMKAAGASVRDASILALDPVNHAYEVSVAVSVPAGAEGGVLLCYDREHFSGIGVGKGEAFTYVRGARADSVGLPASADKASESEAGAVGATGEKGRGGRPRMVYLRIRNDRHDVSFYYSADGVQWIKFEGGTEMSGFHRESFSGWETLRVALYAAGTGEISFADFRYRGYK